MNHRVLPEADGEALEAALRYEDREPGLGNDFLAELERAFGSIRRDPGSLPRLEDYSGPHEIRRCMLRRFPYAVVFLDRPGEALVVAVAHTRRRPLYWLDRLG
ncbi:MAG TPA: hypothetical protein VF170_11825 [Planctomycetaceae bacterium]